MKLFWRFLALMQKKLIISIPIFMLAGIVFGSMFDASFLKQIIVPLTFLMVYPMMVTLNLSSLFKQSNSRLQITTQLINFMVMPLVGLLIGKFFFSGNTYMILGLLLTSLFPTSGMTISWTGMAKGNIQEAIKMTVIGLLLGSILAPFYLKIFMGASIAIPLKSIFSQIGIIILMPMIAGYCTQKFLIKSFGREKYENEYKVKFPPLSTLGVLSVVFVAMALKSRMFTSDPMLVLKIIFPLMLLYLFNFVFSTTVGRLLFDRGDAVSLVYGTVMRNLSVCLAIAMSSFGDKGAEAVLIISLAYVIQVQSAAWYSKISDRFLIEKHQRSDAA